MSENPVVAKEFIALGAPSQTIEPFASRDVSIGSLHVTRALPIKERRLIGPWCLLDRFGPLTFAGEKPMDVAPHPRTGMQTVTWLLDGEVQHHDSLGCEAIARPGGVNVMTAGRGIAHAEQTPTGNTGRLNGVQLWVALPDAHRGVDPSFDGVERVPVADVQVHAREAVVLGLNPEYEHAALVLSGDCAIDNQPLEERVLYYLGTRRSGRFLQQPRRGPRAADWRAAVSRTDSDVVEFRDPLS